MIPRETYLVRLGVARRGRNAGGRRYPTPTKIEGHRHPSETAEHFLEVDFPRGSHHTKQATGSSTAKSDLSWPSQRGGEGVVKTQRGRRISGSNTDFELDGGLRFLLRVFLDEFWWLDLGLA